MAPDAIKDALSEAATRCELLTQLLVRVRALDRLKEFCALARARPRDERLVVFVIDVPSARHFKIASGLQRNGWSVVLLHQGQVPEDQRRFFSKILQFKDREECLLFACMVSPAVYHVFSSWNFEVAELFMQCRPGKIVFESYDVMGGFLQDNLRIEYAKQITQEKFCFESADAVTSRSLQVRYAKRTLGYKIPRQVLFFPDYCWNLTEHLCSRLPKRSDGIHAVYAGGLGSVYFHAARHKAGPNSRVCIEDITNHGIHYHMYPFLPFGQTAEEAHPEYAELARQNPLFHLHAPLTPTELMREMSQYHLGIFSISQGSLREGDKTYIPAYFNIYTANKIFDYLDAGIPSLVGAGRLVHFLMNRTGAAEVSFLDNISEALNVMLQPGRLELLAQHAERGRERYGIDRQARRLIRFYQGVAGIGDSFPIPSRARCSSTSSTSLFE
jgi:hypothetical protein